MRRNGSDLTDTVQGGLFSRWDLILGATLLLFALAAYLLAGLYSREGSKVVIRVDKEVCGIYDLNVDKTVPVTGEGFSNTLVIRDGKADMTEADCPDRICVKHRPVSHVGETIVCLPHKVVVEVIGEGDSPDGFDSISR